MQLNKLTMWIVGLTIGGLLVAGLLIPTINSAQTITGSPVTYTNSMNSTNHYHYDYVDGLVFTADAGATNWTNIKVNGQDITPINDYMLAIVSDGFSMQIGGAGQLSPAVASESYYMPSNFNTSEQTIKIEFKNGHWSAIGGASGTLMEGTYTWVVTYVENGEYIARNGNPTNFYNHGTPEDFILYGGAYSSGELDTYYAYGQGKLTAAVEGYTGTINMINTKVEGTTDVYTCNTCSITITDGENSENYTPYRSLVKETIHGHESKGVNYALFGIIPTLGIVALVAYAATAIRSKY